MMEKLSGATNGWVWKAIFALVSVSFILSGVGGYLISSVDTSAATVNGEKISQQVFQQAYNARTSQLNQQLGDNFSSLMDSPEFVAQVKQEVINQLINQELVRQYRGELGVVINDNQIKRAIVEQSVFQKDGKFDNTLYQQLLRQNNLQPAQYAAQVGQDLALAQLQQGVIGTDFVLPTQENNLISLLFQKRNVRLAAMPMESVLSAQKVTEEDAKNYYETHLNDFKVPELVKVAYIDISKDDVAKNLSVSDVQIAQYYQDHTEDFSSQKEQNLAMIQVADKVKADEAYKQLQNGGNFATIAKAISTDPLTAKNGGDLSWVTPGALPPKFESEANKIAIGKYSQPFLLDNKYYIVEVKARRGGAKLPLSEVKSQIIDRIRSQELTQGFYRVEKDVAEKAFEDQTSLDAAAKVLGKPVVTTGYFSRTDIPAVLNFSNVTYNIFDTDLIQGGENSEAINVGNQHSIIVRVIDHKPAGTKTFAEAKTDIINMLKQQEAEKVLLTNAKAEVIKLQKDGLPANNFANGVTFADSKSYVYGEMQDLPLRAAIFSMKAPLPGKATFSAAIDNKGQVVILELTSVEAGSLEPAAQQQVMSAYLQSSQNASFDQLIASLREQAKIKINKEFIQQVGN